jgi:molybdate transport system substrate-binding protein
MKQLILFFLTSVLFLSCQTSQKQELRIAAAANMQFAMEAITKAFAEQTGIKSETVIGSSGKLTAQIKASAPYDIFISADMKYPNFLYENGFAKHPPKVYAKGKLVLWSVKEGIVPSISILTTPQIRHIVLANPKIAPYGKAAMETIQSYELEERVKDKFVFGESIAQTNQFIHSQAAEIGFTAKSVVLSPLMKNKGQWIEIPDSLYSPIEQGIILLNEPSKAALAFQNFLFSKKGKAILETYGYEVDR